MVTQRSIKALILFPTHCSARYELRSSYLVQCDVHCTSCTHYAPQNSGDSRNACFYGRNELIDKQCTHNQSFDWRHRRNERVNENAAEEDWASFTVLLPFAWLNSREAVSAPWSTWHCSCEPTLDNPRVCLWEEHYESAICASLTSNFLHFFSHYTGNLRGIFT